MARLKSGISQIGGKFRLLNTVLQYIPLHEFYLEPFLGSAIVLLNKPRCRYECGNDFDSELINYLLMTREHPKEFDELKQGILGLVSQEICNRIVNGKLQPKDDLERAYFFYYLNKLSFGGDQTDYKYRGITLPGVTRDIAEKAKAHYCGLMPDPIRQPQVDNIKSKFREITPKANYKGINPKTTRPYTNNDCGLLTPLDMKAIERLRYVNLTAYDFRKVYDLFYKAFHERKGLERECFVYIDRPYPGTEKYYGNKFDPENHKILNDIVINSPFNIMESLGGDCEWIIDFYKEHGLIIKEVYTKYSTNANTQKPVREFLIMNYDINKIPKMIQDHQIDILSFGNKGEKQ